MRSSVIRAGAMSRSYGVGTVIESSVIEPFLATSPTRAPGKDAPGEPPATEKTTRTHRSTRTRPKTQDPRPKTQDPRPTTHDPRPTTHDPRDREAMHAGTQGE